MPITPAKPSQKLESMRSVVSDGGASVRVISRPRPVNATARMIQLRKIPVMAKAKLAKEWRTAANRDLPRGEFAASAENVSITSFWELSPIAEAAERENTRFVPIKTEDQLDLQTYIGCAAAGAEEASNAASMRCRMSA